MHEMFTEMFTVLCWLSARDVSIRSCKLSKVVIARKSPARTTLFKGVNFHWNARKRTRKSQPHVCAGVFQLCPHPVHKCRRYVCKDRTPHRELRVLLFTNSGWDLYHPTSLCETWPTVYRPYPRRLVSLTICSTFSSVKVPQPTETSGRPFGRLGKQTNSLVYSFLSSFTTFIFVKVMGKYCFKQVY